jgi:hypothetical protein
MIVSEIALYNVLKNKFGEKEAQEVVEGIKALAKDEFDKKKEVYLTKDDKIDIMRSIYISGVVQYLAILGSMLALIKLMK